MMKRILTVWAVSAMLAPMTVGAAPLGLPAGSTLTRGDRVEQKLEIMSSRMCQVQENRVGAMRRHLGKMSEILDRVMSRVQEAKNRGKDIAAVEQAVNRARVAIRVAEVAVADAARKNCELNVTGDNVGSRVAAIRREMQSSLGGSQRKVSVARKAVAAAIRILAQVLGRGAGSDATGSGGVR